VDNCVSVWRPKEKKAGSWDCIVKVDKQRHGEWEGKFGFYFHPESQSYCEDEKLKPPSVQIGREESF
jgi:twinkle protein